MFKRILVGVDGSPESSAGLDSAVALASDQQATLLALHVIDDGSLPINFDGALCPPSYVDAYAEAIRTIGRKILDRTQKVARANSVKVDCILVRSGGISVAEVIVAQGRKLNADIIVLGTHGRRGLKRVLMGSDAEQVVREANVPVLLVRGRKKRARASASAKRRAPAKAARSPAPTRISTPGRERVVR